MHFMIPLSADHWFLNPAQVLQQVVRKSMGLQDGEQYMTWRNSASLCESLDIFLIKPWNLFHFFSFFFFSFCWIKKIHGIREATVFGMEATSRLWFPEQFFKSFWDLKTIRSPSVHSCWKWRSLENQFWLYSIVIVVASHFYFYLASNNWSIFVPMMSEGYCMIY